MPDNDHIPSCDCNYSYHVDGGCSCPIGCSYLSSRPEDAIGEMAEVIGVLQQRVAERDRSRPAGFTIICNLPGCASWTPHQEQIPGLLHVHREEAFNA